MDAGQETYSLLFLPGECHALIESLVTRHSETETSFIDLVSKQCTKPLSNDVWCTPALAADGLDMTWWSLFKEKEITIKKHENGDEVERVNSVS